MSDAYDKIEARDIYGDVIKRSDSPPTWGVGSWLSAALDDPSVCDEMKADIRAWFDGGGHLRTTIRVGEITMFGATTKEVAWRKGKMPAFGTVLYSINSDAES